MRNQHTLKSLVLILCLSLMGFAQIEVGKKPAGPVLLKNATIHLGTGEVLQGGALAFADGKITGVFPAGSALQEAGHEVVDLAGAHVYPGFILPDSDMGLTEVEALKATIDHTETGEVNPNVRTLIAYDTDSELIPTTRANGLTLVHVTPRGGLVSGTSSVMALDGWNWEDAAYAADMGIHIEWPGLMTNKFDFATQTRSWEKNKDYESAVATVAQLLQDAKGYAAAKAGSLPTNLKLQSLVGLFNGEKTLFLHANHSRTIVDGVLTAERLGVKRTVIVGGEGALDVADFLVAHKVAVIVKELHRLPDTASAEVNAPYKLPARLKKAGVQFCLGYDSSMSARNLPFLAGTAVAWGLSQEEAIQAITLDTARILGIDKLTGSLEVGKDANLFVSTGDALDMRSNHLTHLYIRGKSVPLKGRQERLYEHFKH